MTPQKLAEKYRKIIAEKLPKITTAHEDADADGCALLLILVFPWMTFYFPQLDLLLLLLLLGYRRGKLSVYICCKCHIMYSL